MLLNILVMNTGLVYWFLNMSHLLTKPTKWHVCPAKTQLSLGIHPVWSESSLCTQWVAKDPSFLHADSEDSDQTGRMPGLIWVFIWRSHVVGFVMLQLICGVSVAQSRAWAEQLPKVGRSPTYVEALSGHHWGIVGCLGLKSANQLQYSKMAVCYRFPRILWILGQQIFCLTALLNAPICYRIGHVFLKTFNSYCLTTKSS